MQSIEKVLSAVEIGTPVTVRNLTMFPLLRTDVRPADYRLLDEALEAELAEVTEISSGGSVPELRFRNKSDADILLVDGEELVGAKQNRVLNLSILVGAGQDVTIPVSCVEAGRWAWRSQRFSAGGRKLNARARMQKMRGVTVALRSEGTRSRPEIQAEVWRSVDDKLSFFECHSDTRSLHDAYEATERDLMGIREVFAPQTGQVGAVFAIDGRLAGTEFFDAAGTLAKLLPKLVDSYAFDALESDVDLDLFSPPSISEVRALLDRIAQAPASAHAAVAKGTDVRIEAPHLHAAALVDAERTVHLSAFARADD